MAREQSKAKAYSKTMRMLKLPSSELRRVFQSISKQHQSRMNKAGEIEDRYVFDDDSALIVTDGSGWGVEGKVPWSWKAVTFQDKK